MGNDFWNLSATIWANWIIQSRAVIFQSFDNFLVCRPPSWHFATICDVTTAQLSNGTIHNLLFMKMYLPLLLYLGMLGLRWLCMQNCMHLWLNLINWSVDIQENLKIVKRGHTKLCIIISFKRIFQICSKFYCWVSKIVFYSPNPHCCLGKLSLSVNLSFMMACLCVANPVRSIKYLGLTNS